MSLDAYISNADGTDLGTYAEVTSTLKMLFPNSVWNHREHSLTEIRDSKGEGLSILQHLDDQTLESLDRMRTQCVISCESSTIEIHGFDESPILGLVVSISGRSFPKEEILRMTQSTGWLLRCDL
ncbi:MAG: hypothetical protein ACRC8S_17090 [Fimbriiglobus sp.]